MILFVVGGWLQISTSFSVSGKYFSRVGSSLSHSNCISSIWIFYVLLMNMASFLTWPIRVSVYQCNVGWSLMLPTWLHSTIITLPKCFTSASHLRASYMNCDKSLVFAGITCTKLLQFSLALCSPKLIESLEILDFICILTY